MAKYATILHANIKVFNDIGFWYCGNLTLFCLRSYEHGVDVNKKTTLLSIQVGCGKAGTAHAHHPPFLILPGLFAIYLLWLFPYVGSQRKSYCKIAQWTVSPNSSLIHTTVFHYILADQNCWHLSVFRYIKIYNHIKTLLCSVLPEEKCEKIS